MRYLGGKYRMAPKFAHIINNICPDGIIWDAFCGGLGFAEAFPDRQLLCTDLNAALITLYQSWCDGWRPDLSTINKDKYMEYKTKKDPRDPLTAFLGFGCSFGGKWFGGWASCPAINYPRQAFNSLNRTLENRPVPIAFARLNFLENLCSSPVVYCDPPYINTTGYCGVDKIDHAQFWAQCERIVSRGQHVFVSEQAAPSGWDTLWEHKRKPTSSRKKTDATITERLFYKPPG